MEQKQRNSNVAQKEKISNGVKGMTIIVKTIGSWAKVLIFLFGIYIVLFGHLTPGGGFAGGVMIASAYVLLMLAFGGEFVKQNLSPSLALKLACAGTLAFAAIAVAGFFYGPDGFFWNFIGQEWLAGESSNLHFINAGIIMLAELAVGVIVAAAIFLVIFTFSTFKFDVSDNQKE